ncbi:hypothetical protein K469DRAFT_773152 [Zopfia rhizophila CBS 207.26]|uniref:Uncharacterized protein n=1 Tax=Zopfia rhizophila CBS 207.26 TaxID=1314779 RepID=A0A6A6E7X4_9PEZI|nr:hypothetical protein K469DRAFT_773152 [Zopfia rhizophila CBS 207.26]
MGATKIVAIGKPGPKLEKKLQIGATLTTTLTGKLEEVDFDATANVDAVLDYIWGETAKAALSGIILKRKNKSQHLIWAEIGALAGDANSASASLLRQANVVCGCGPGSWTFPDLGNQLSTMLKAIAEKGLKADLWFGSWLM